MSFLKKFSLENVLNARPRPPDWGPGPMGHDNFFPTLSTALQTKMKILFVLLRYLPWRGRPRRRWMDEVKGMWREEGDLGTKLSNRTMEQSTAKAGFSQLLDPPEVEQDYASTPVPSTWVLEIVPWCKVWQVW